ncbi:hypothetical protein ACFLXC_04055 [Chloroflexota bacterium]
MEIDALKKYEGQWVSVVVRGIPRTAGGHLYLVGKDFIGINNVSEKIHEIMISAEDIVSVLIRKQEGENNGRTNMLQDKSLECRDAKSE